MLRTDQAFFLRREGNEKNIFIDFYTVQLNHLFSIICFLFLHINYSVNFTEVSQKPKI